MEEPAPALGPQQDLNALETEESAEHAPTLSSRGLEVDSAEGGENVHRVRADAPEGNERELPSSKQTDLPDMATRLEHDADKLAKSVRDMLICLQSKIENISAVTLQAADVYHDAVDEYTLLCDDAMTNMMHLVARCDELDADMEPVYDLVVQMYDIPLS